MFTKCHEVVMNSSPSELCNNKSQQPTYRGRAFPLAQQQPVACSQDELVATNNRGLAMNRPNMVDLDMAKH